MKKVRAIIAGGRNITNIGLVHLAITEAVEAHDWEIIEVVSGGAQGVDRMGEALALQHRRKVKRFPADWHMYGKVAGPIRNKQMGIYADVLILIWDGISPGSANMYETMAKLGKPIWEYLVSAEEMAEMKAEEEKLYKERRRERK